MTSAMGRGTRVYTKSRQSKQIGMLCGLGGRQSKSVRTSFMKAPQEDIHIQYYVRTGGGGGPPKGGGFYEKVAES